MEEKEFDNIISYDDMTVGYIKGSSVVLFIKTGQGGSIYGDNNRYIDLARLVNEKYGLSVFVSATTVDSRSAFDRDIGVVEEILETSDFDMRYLGVSKGGLIGIWHGADEGRITAMISINAPLMINYHGKTLPGVKKLGRDKLTMIYGNLDPSYNYVPFVEKYANVWIVDGADHNFRNSKPLAEIASSLWMK